MQTVDDFSLTKTHTKKTIASFLLDRSGSMESIKSDTIGGFNSYVETLKKSGADIDFSLVQFDSHGIDKLYVGMPIGQVAPLTADTYVPRGGTPLIDAACKIIKATDAQPKPPGARIVVVLQTDGEENSSSEFKLSDLNALIRERTAAGWEFVFLGAGIDAYKMSSSMNIRASATMSYDRRNSAQTFAAMASNTASYANREAATMDWNEAQKDASGDFVPGRPKAP